jgi:hypothetical protein
MPYDDWGELLGEDIDSDTGLPADVVRRYYAPCRDIYEGETEGESTDSHDFWDDADSERAYSSDSEPFEYSDSEQDSEGSEECVSEDEDGSLVAHRTIRIQRSRCCMLPRMPVEILQMVRLVFVNFPPFVIQLAARYAR